MKFTILNREQAEIYEYSEPHVNISISSPKDPRAVLSPLAMGRKASLFLEFHDIDDIELNGAPIIMNGIVLKEKPGQYYQDRVQCITQEQAKQIINFFNEWKSEVNLFVINCYAGISRSSATAAALAILCGQSDKFVFQNKKYHPNMLVYRTILNEAQK